jgi:hypothetical protein
MGVLGVKLQNSIRTKTARILSDAIIAKRYLDLQQLREAVRIAEMSCAAALSKKPQHRKATSDLLLAQAANKASAEAH